jgi:homoserine/homoserine lactone efflux protein
MGINMLRGGRANIAQQCAEKANFRRGFVTGLAVHMSNPKALLFYAAFIPPFIDPAGNLWLQFAILAGLTVFTETAGLTFYAALASRARNMGDADRLQPMFGKLAAIVLIGAAILLGWWNLADSGPKTAFNLVTGRVG